jgi:hypothetical protein
MLGQGTADKLIAAAAKPPPLNFPNDAASAQAFVGMIDPAGAVTPSPEPELPHVPDPLCKPS